MDPLTLCLKRQRTGYATAPGYPWQASDYPLPVLFIFHLAHSPGLCLWGMRVVLLVRGWNPSWHFAWPWTGAVKGSNSIFLFSHFPLLHFFFFLLCSLFVAFAKLCPVYFSISAQGIYQFLSRSVWPRRSRKCVQSGQLSSCEICGPPDDFCLAFLWSWMADRSVPPTWQLS